MEKWDFWVKIIVPEWIIKLKQAETKLKAQKFLFLPDSAIEGSLRKQFEQMTEWALEHINETRRKFYSGLNVEMELRIKEEKAIRKYLNDFFNYLVFNIKSPQFDRDDLQKTFDAMNWLVYAFAWYIEDEEKKFLKNLETQSQLPSYMELMDNLNFSQEKQAKFLDQAYCYHISTIFQILTTIDKSCYTYQKDVRNWWKFAEYFSEGWIMEDVMEEWFDDLFGKSKVLEQQGYEATCQLEGDDKNRKLCSWFKKISGNPDFQIFFKKKQWGNIKQEVAKVELQKVKFYPNPTTPIHIKIHKFKKSKAQNSLILLVFPGQWKFCLFHANEFANNARVMKVNLLASWGNKPVHTLTQKDIEEIGVYEFWDKVGLKKAINKMLKVKSLVA